MKEFTILMALLVSNVAISNDAILPALGLIVADMRGAQPQPRQEA